MNKKKVLFVCYRNPYPVTSGEKITMMQNLVILSKKYNVDCLILSEEPIGIEAEAVLKKYAHRLIIFPGNKMVLRIARVMSFFFRFKPLQNGYFFSKGIRDFIYSNHRKYDCIFCSHMRTGQYVTKLEGVKKVLDCPDCITSNVSSVANTSRFFKKALYSAELKRVRRFETQEYDGFDRVFVISEKDRESLLLLNPGLEPRLSLLYNYVRDLGYDPNAEEGLGPTACFLGKVGYKPNEDAILFFADRIFPTLKKTYPSFVFNIYGGGVTARIKNLGQRPGIIVHGFVDNVGAAIQANTIVVAPMISGSGTQNKILEAMLLGKTVLTTTLGAEGLHGLTGEELVVCPNDEAFLDRCLHFLDASSRGERIRIGKQAREYVQKEFSLSIVERQLLDNMPI